MKVVVAGATGFIGKPLVRDLIDAGHEVVVLSRGSGAGPAGARLVTWDAASPDGAWAQELRGADGVINLAGANIGEKRWTNARKQEIVESRVSSTSAIVGAIERLEPADRPRVLVNSSGIDFYGDTGDAVVTEDSRAGDDFLAQVCVRWEAAARAAEPLGVRVVLMRTGVVLGRDSVALGRMAMPFKFLAGGPLGGGKQWFPWIHLVDAIGLYRLAVENEVARGPINGVAPDLRPHKDFAAAMGRVLGRPSWAPAPSFALRLVLGEQADLLLHGRRAEPREALALGYQYRFPQLEEALRETLA